MNTKQPIACGLLATALFASAAWAHGPSSHASNANAPITAASEQTAWGIAGQATQVQRTIALRMTDDMKFTPNQITVKLGQTVRLVAHNQGQVMHEIVLGTAKELAQHAEMMKKHPNMEHDEPYMAHVAPGQKGEIIWTFNRAGTFEFACLIAGHFEAGMKGRIVVQ